MENLVSKFNHLKIKDPNTPFDSNVKLEKDNGRAVAQLEYENAIENLMFAPQRTKDNISLRSIN